MEKIRQGLSSEGPLQASKWLSSQALLEVEEMSDLLNVLNPLKLYKCGGIQKKDEAFVNNHFFLENYKRYIDALKAGAIPDISFYRPLFSLAMTLTEDALFSVPLPDNKEIIRICRPIIQMQIHQMSYSTVDKKFHPMVFGLDSIAWGVQFSYPQLFQDEKTKKVENVKDTEDFPNTKAFHTLQKWMRANTIPTPFIAEGTLTNVPMRLGKKCTSWINQHKQLIHKGISVRC